MCKDISMQWYGLSTASCSPAQVMTSGSVCGMLAAASSSSNHGTATAQVVRRQVSRRRLHRLQDHPRDAKKGERLTKLKGFYHPVSCLQFNPTRAGQLVIGS